MKQDPLGRGTDSNVKGEMIKGNDATEGNVELSERLNSADVMPPEERNRFHRFRETLQKCWSQHGKTVCGVIVILLIVHIITISVVLSRVSVSVEPTFSPLSPVCVPWEPPCATGWVGYEGKCYFFSEEERNWTSSQMFCTLHGSYLASIKSEQEKVFMLRYKGNADHWIGLQKDPGQGWRWADGTEFNNTVEVRGQGEDCAFLSTANAIVSRCYIRRNWICNHPDAYSEDRSSTIRQH